MTRGSSSVQVTWHLVPNRPDMTLPENFIGKWLVSCHGRHVPRCGRGSGGAPGGARMRTITIVIRDLPKGAGATVITDAGAPAIGQPRERTTCRQP